MPSPRSLLAAAAALAAVVGPALPASAAATTVTDAASLTRAFAAAAPGDTITLAPGDYGAVTVRDRTWAAPVRIAGQPGARFSSLTVLRVGGLDVSGVEVADEIAVRGGSRVTVHDSRSAGVMIRDGATAVVVRDNELVGGTNGVTVYGADGAPRVRDVLVTGNRITGQEHDAVRVTRGDDVRVVANQLVDTVDNANHNDGVQSLGSTGLLIERNTIHGHDTGVMLNPLAGASIAATTIRNNVIRANHGAAVNLVRTVDTVVAFNSMADNGAADVHVEPGNTGHRVSGNVLTDYWVVRGAVAPDLAGNCGARTGGATDLAAPARFVPGDGLLHLAADSPCRDRGPSVDVPSVDHAGHVRGTPTDAGAHDG